MYLKNNTVVAPLNKTTPPNYQLDEIVQGEGDPYQLFQNEVKVTTSLNHPLEEIVLGEGDPYQLLQGELKVELEDKGKPKARTIKLTNPWKHNNRFVEIPGSGKYPHSQSSSDSILAEKPTDHEHLHDFDDPDDPDDPDNVGLSLADQSQTQHLIRSNSENKLPKSSKTNLNKIKEKTKLQYKTQEKQSYTQSEDIDVLNFLIKGSFFRLTKSDMIWKHMKEKGLNPSRSWQGLRTRFHRNILPNLDKYGLTHQMILMSDRAPSSEKVLLPQSLDGDEEVVTVKKPYSMEEDKKIIQYIIKNNKFSYVKGAKMWKEMENCGIVTKRSFMSLMRRFNTVIFPNIEAYNLIESDLSKFQKIEETRLKLRSINKTNKSTDTRIDHTSATCSVNMDKELLNSKVHSLFNKPEITKQGVYVNIGKQKSKYVCNICGYTARYKSSAINHVTIHIKELIYTCSNCTYTAKTRDYINNHIRKLSKETQKAFNNRTK